MKNISILSSKATDLLAEAETYFFYRRNLSKTLKELFKRYQEGKYSYAQYEDAKRKMLKGRSEDEWRSYYDSYILSLIKRVEAYNNQIFYETYNDERYLMVKARQPVPELKPAAAVPAVRNTEVLAPALPGELLKVKESIKEEKRAQRLKAEAERQEAEKEIRIAEKERAALEKALAEDRAEAERLKELGLAGMEAPTAAVEAKLVEIKPTFTEKIATFFRRIFARREIEAKISEIRGPEAAKAPAKKGAAAEAAKGAEKPGAAEAPQGLERFAKTPFQKKLYKGETIMHGEPMSMVKAGGKKTFGQAMKDSLFSIIARKPERVITPKEAERAAVDRRQKKPEEGILVGGFFSLSTIKRMFGIQQRKVAYGENTVVGRSTLELETLRRKAQPAIAEEIEKITATALTKEASRIRAIMQKRKTLKIYQPSFFGSLANVTIKKISLSLLDTFPDFFKELYHALRLANIKVLSNTYVNMMVLGVMFSFLIGLVVTGIFFTSTGLPIGQVLFRTFAMSLLIALVAFAGFYQYPYSILKQRRRSINSNLPFAINHMAAVASSGVAPTRMFQLLSQSKEYGEISTELEKIVNYIEIFGYDILTALKSVGATTPSDAFKDFMEGMISTTESGGDIKSYLAQKSDEAIMNYKLDRQKYTETISTYSDIYTGILIAAPLFFVAALSLVSLLGGKIGGIGVNVIITLGTYVMIPILNIGFLAFLEMTQPEI